MPLWRADGRQRCRIVDIRNPSTRGSAPAELLINTPVAVEMIHSLLIRPMINNKTPAGAYKASWFYPLIIAQLFLALL